MDIFKKKWFKKTAAAIAFIMLLLFAIKRENMTLRQSLLKTFYPVIMAFSKQKEILENKEKVQPPVSFYTLSAINNKGAIVQFDQFRGRKVLLVNTASDCGYTGQYADLQKLYEKYKAILVVLAFPANDFKEQEKKSDAEIAQFCAANFNTTFPLMKKSIVAKGADQNTVFAWLTQKNKNGWNDTQPGWNFSKYLVDENGMLTNYFSTTVSPLDEQVIAALQ